MKSRMRSLSGLAPSDVGTTCSSLAASGRRSDGGCWWSSARTGRFGCVEASRSLRSVSRSAMGTAEVLKSRAGQWAGQEDARRRPGRRKSRSRPLVEGPSSVRSSQARSPGTALPCGSGLRCWSCEPASASRSAALRHGPNSALISAELAAYGLRHCQAKLLRHEGAPADAEQSAPACPREAAVLLSSSANSARLIEAWIGKPGWFSALLGVVFGPEGGGCRHVAACGESRAHSNPS
jgi:hypothetical protein